MTACKGQSKTKEFDQSKELPPPTARIHRHPQSLCADSSPLSRFLVPAPPLHHSSVHRSVSACTRKGYDRFLPCSYQCHCSSVPSIHLTFRRRNNHLRCSPSAP